MRKTGKKLTAIGLVIIMMLQISHLENYRFIREVSAAPVEDTTTATEENQETEQQEEEQGNVLQLETAEDSENSSGETGNETNVEVNPETLEESEDTNTQQVNVQDDSAEIPQDTALYDGVDWTDFAVTGDVIEGDYSNEEAIKLTSDLLIKGDLDIRNPLALNGHALIVEGVVTQNSDFIVNGDFITYDNFVWYRGDTTFENGYADIAGDLQATNGYQSVFSMEHETDYLCVEGNFTLGQGNALTTNITDGTLELKGDFTQQIVASSSGSYYYPQGDFYAGGNSTLLLSGEEQQNIYIAKENSGFKNITVATYGLEKDKDGNYLFGDRLIGFSGYCNYENYEDYGCPTTYGYAIYDEKKINSDTIYGSCYYIGEPWHLSGKNIKIIGDFIQNGDLYLEGGSLSVYGDYRIQSIDGRGEYGETEGKLVVQQSCYIYVYGDFVTESVVDHTGLLTNGTWYIYGDLYQHGESYINFVTSDNLKINMSTIYGNGVRECHIVMDNPLNNPIKYLYGMSSEVKFVIENGVTVGANSYLGVYSGYAILMNLSGSATFDGDVVIMTDETISGHLTVNGELTVKSDVTVTGTLSVKKDMTVEKGVITIDGGTINAVDVSFQDGSDSALVMEKAMSSLYCEEFYYGSNRKSGNLTNGYINFTKDFYVKDTGTPDSFVCSGAHIVRAYGSEHQHVTIENPASNIETLLMTSGGPVKPVNDTVIHNIINSTGTYAWEGIEGYTLEKDEVYDEDFILSCGTLDLNGHTLTINGDLYAGQGSIYIHGGSLVVNGNLNLVYRDWQTGKMELKYSRADIVMDDENDRVDIAGDFYAIFSTDSLKSMQKGNLYLSGDMQIDGTIGQLGASRPAVMDGVSLHLTGNEKQSIMSSSPNMLLRFGDFIVENGQAINVEVSIRVNDVLQLPDTYQFYEITIQNLDVIGRQSFKGHVIAYKSVLTGDIHIEGDLSIAGQTDLCGYNIHADKITVNSSTNLSGGGIYAKQLYMNDCIYMRNPEDIIKTKDFYVNVRTLSSNYMTEGNIYITGNFTDNTVSSYAFLPSGNHTVIFDVPINETTRITFNNKDSILNRAVFNSLINQYTINRKKEEIARELIIGYEDQEKPETPELIMCESSGIYAVKLQWNEVTDNMEVDSYKLYRDGVCITTTDETRYLDMVLRPSTEYSYSVSAVDVAGNESEQSKVRTITTEKAVGEPYQKKKPTIKVVEDKVTISFEDLFYDYGNYIDYYILTKDGEEIAQFANNFSITYCDWDNNYVSKQIREGNVLVYTEEGLQYGELHEYCLYPVDSAGKVLDGHTMEAVANFPPGSVEGFSVVSENGYNILFFEKSGGAECASYYIYRDGKHIGAVTNDKKGMASYIDTNVTVDNSYTYYVVARNRYSTYGERTEECTVTTVDEKIPPVIEEINSSIPGDIINENLQLQVKATDDGGVKSIRAFIVKQGEEKQIQVYNQTALEVGTSLTVKFTLGTQDLQGTYELHIVAADYSDNETEQILTYKINIDGLPPVTITRQGTTTSLVFFEWEPVEGAAYYLIEQYQAGVYKQIGKTEDTGCLFQNLTYNSKYCYRVVAYDKDGIRGLATEDIILVTQPDTEAPRITNVYKNYSVLGLDSYLEVGYADNIRVNIIRAYYRKSGEEEWKLINESSVYYKSGSIKLVWDKEGLTSGIYEVRYEAEDTSGNISQEVIGIYELDLGGPEIHNFVLTPQDWKIQLDWDAFEEEDYSRYEIRYMLASEYDEAVRRGEDYTDNAVHLKRGKNETTYEFMVSPKEEYVYILYAYDKYGNVTTAAVRGYSIDNDIFPPTVISVPPLLAAQDMAISLSANGCMDNDEIVSYEWDMGNGDVVFGKECEYTYREAGTYDLTLTAVDRSGNSSSKTTTVTVAKDTGIIDVTVTSGGKKISGADVVACMNGKACYSSSGSRTNSQGELSFPMSEGIYQFAAYKDGYLPAEVTVVVKAGERKSVTIELEQGDMVTAEFETREMTKEEMEKAGIDTTANETVFECTMELRYNNKFIDSIVFNSTQDYVEFTIPNYGSSVEGDVTGGSGYGNDMKVTVHNISSDPEHPVYVITKTVNVGISWLQNIYQVDVTIKNEAGKSFSLEETEAVLNLPDGLELATMQDGGNSSKWNIGVLNGGESATHTWFVGGNKSGSYPLQINFEAMMQPFNIKIKKELKSVDDLVVQVGKGLHLYIYPEENAYIGEDYYVQFQLRNESTEDYHYVTVSGNFGAFETTTAKARVIVIRDANGEETISTTTADTGVNYYLDDEAKKNPNIILWQNDTVTVETLEAGQAIYGTWRFRFDAAGDINREYYRLLNQYAEVMNANSTNVTVTLEPIMSHLAKKVAQINSAKKTKKSNSTGSTTTNSGGTTGGDTTSGNTTGNNTTTQPTPIEPIPNVPSTPDSTESVKDPVNLMTGAFTVDHVVAAVAGAEILNFGLSYNSLYTNAVGDLGRGWYHNYEKHLERNGSILAFYQNPNEVLYFKESEDTADVVCGTMEDNTIVLSDDSSVERTYYQEGIDNSKYRIIKNGEGYVVSDGQIKYTFALDGTLTGYINEIGQKVAIAKTEDGITITDQATGKSITAFYNEDGRITSVVDAAGKKTLLSYEGDCMTVLTGKTGNKLVYEYDEQGHILIGKDGEQTVYVENTYDEKGRVLTQISNGKKKEQTSFAYSENEDGTLLVTMTNADGTTEKAVSDIYGQGISYENAIGGMTEYSYNDLKDMTAYRQPDGTGADYTYDEAGNITKVVETTGKATTYSYDSDNRVIHMTCNDGTDIQYTYNAAGQIETVTGSNGLKATYTYDENGQILTETSALGTITYSYQDDMLHSITDYNGNTHIFAYDANGNVTQYADTGAVTDYKVDVSGRVTEESVVLEDGRTAKVSYTYDAYGKMLSKTDAEGNTTNYVYDEEDRLIEEIRPDGKSFSYSYDANGNVTKVVCPDGKTVMESVYDAAGNALSLTNTLKGIQTANYSAGNQLLSMMQSNGGEIQYTYYDNGLLKSQTDANGNTTTLVYDAAGRISKVMDGTGATTTYGYDEEGNLASVENALGNSIQMEYNKFRKVIRQTDANGNVTTYDYDNALNCIRATDAEEGVTEFAYDGAGRILSMTKKGDSKTQDVTISMTYDNLGNVTSLTDGEGNTSRMEYDLNSNLTAVYDAKGVKTEGYVYDCVGNCTEVTDALGNVTKNSYDAMGNLIKQMNEATGNAVTYSYVGGMYLSSSTDAMESTASATYDSMGNLSTLTNPNGGVTSYKYDLNNNLTDEIIGDDYHIRYTYNAQNLAATKTNSRDQKAVYEYDALGRITKQTDEAGIIEYTYDANDNVLTVTETVGDTVNTITRTYDGLNRVTSYEDAKGNKIGYGYDKLGNLVTLTYPNGKEVHYTYDKNSNIETVTDWNGRVTKYDYDENGRLVKTERPNGTIETRTYDKAGRLTKILDKSGETVVNQQDYSYDAEGNITEVKQLYSGELNFTSVTSAQMTYDKNNRLLAYNGEKIQYDKDGNMTYGPLQGKMTKFEFDCRNRLIKAGDTSYTYDAENNRIAVTTGAKRTEYVINTQPELSQVLQSTTTNGSKVEATYYFYGRGLIAQDNSSSGYLTYHFNNVGSTMAVTDQTGAVKYAYNYSPYGELLEGEYNETIPFLYNGQYGVTTDANGLYYMRARYYNVDIKRFINQDVLTGTLERISSLNRYSYVEGNPVSYLDPFGLEPFDTSGIHMILSILGAIAAVLTLFPATAPYATIVSAIISSIDIVVRIYDLCYAIKNNDTDSQLIAIAGIAADIVGLLSGAISHNIVSTYNKSKDFPWIAEGFLYKITYINEMNNEFSPPLVRATVLATAITIIEEVVKQIKASEE